MEQQMNLINEINTLKDDKEFYRGIHCDFCGSIIPVTGLGFNPLQFDEYFNNLVSNIDKCKLVNLNELKELIMKVYSDGYNHGKIDLAFEQS